MLTKLRLLRVESNLQSNQVLHDDIHEIWACISTKETFTNSTTPLYVETFSLDPNHSNGVHMFINIIQSNESHYAMAKIFLKIYFQSMYQCHMGYINVPITYYAIPMHSSTILVLEYVPM